MRKGILTVLACGFAALAAADTALAKSTLVMPFNMALFWNFHGLNIHQPWLTGPMLALTYLGSDSLLFAFVIVLSIGLAIRKWLVEAWWLIGLTVFARILDTVAKNLVQSPRPPLVVPAGRLHAFSGYGFPSGHALMSSVVFGFVAVLAMRRAKTGAVGVIAAAISAALILAIGASRIYLDAHWANDILGGYLYGGSVLISACLIRSKERRC